MAQEVREMRVWGDTGQLEECLRMLLRGEQMEYEEMATMFDQAASSLSH